MPAADSCGAICFLCFKNRNDIRAAAADSRFSVLICRTGYFDFYLPVSGRF